MLVMKKIVSNLVTSLFVQLVGNISSRIVRLHNQNAHRCQVGQGLVVCYNSFESQISLMPRIEKMMAKPHENTIK